MPRPQPDFHEIVSDLRLASFRLSRRLQSERAVPELSDSQLGVVGLLIRVNTPLTLGAVADYCGVTPSSMSRTINILETAGYIHRLTDPQDGRRVLVAATEQGVAMVEATRQRRDDWLESELADLSDEDLAAIARVTRIMLEIARH